MSRAALARPNIDWLPVRLTCYVVVVGFLAHWAVRLGLYLADPNPDYAGVDYRLYMDATARWLAGGPFYEAYQLTGPYEIAAGDILYPPTALPLFIAFQVLPAWAWWVVPVTGTIAMVASYRPNALALVAITICFWYPTTSIKLLTGNPVLWVMLAVALGTRWAAAAPWALIKPSLFPFGAVGIRRRTWWVSFAVMGGLAVVLWPLTRDWLTAVRNGISSGGLLYSWQEAPMLLIPVIAWIARPRPAPRPRGGDGPLAP